jgi:hypothetical protein
VEILTNSADVMAALNDFAALNGPIVVHGTLAPISAGCEMVPKTCLMSSANMQGEQISWSAMPPYIFAALPEYADLGIFIGTFRPDILSRTAGVRDISTDPNTSRLLYKAAEPAKANARTRLARLCLMPAETFEPSPTGSWAERASRASVRAIGVYGVYCSALSFDLDTIASEFPTYDVRDSS